MYLTHQAYLNRIANMNSKYWNEGKKYRWQYMSYVIDALQIMGAKKTIEAGASGMPLNSDSFLMDYPEYDLNKIPYKIIISEKIKIQSGEMEKITEVYSPYAKDKYFDCFIALQVWEHLDRQEDAFREVMRISKAAILSFPYKWTWGDKRHRGIDGKKIEKWTCGVVPEKIKIINHRAIYVFKF